MLKINDKVQIVKGPAKSDKIWTVISKQFNLCGSHTVKIACEDELLTYDVTFLKRINQTQNNDLIKRQSTLNIISSKLKEEERDLKLAKTEYRKRLSSYRIVLLRDLYEIFENVPSIEK